MTVSLTFCPWVTDSDPIPETEKLNEASAAAGFGVPLAVRYRQRPITIAASLIEGIHMRTQYLTYVSNLHRSALVLLAALALPLGACSSTEVPIQSTDPVAGVTMAAVSASLEPGETALVTGVPRDARGRALAGRVLTWSSSDPAVARVSAEGIVTALAPGVAQIVASSEGRTAAVSFSVRPLVGTTMECRSPRPEWIWCDDFEEDRLPRYSEYESRDSFERVAGIGYGGSTGMRARFRLDQVNAGYLHVHFGKVPSAGFRPVDGGTQIYRDIYWRVYVRYAPDWTGGGGNKMSRAQSLASREWAQAMIAHVWTPSEPLDRLFIEPASGIGPRGRLLTREYNDFPNLIWLGQDWTGTPLFAQASLGKWYCVEARARLNDPGRSNGVFELWVNDRLEARLSGLGWMGSFVDYGINAVYVENYWNEGAPKRQERYFDDFIVSTQRIGCWSKRPTPGR